LMVADWKIAMIYKDNVASGEAPKGVLAKDPRFGGKLFTPHWHEDGANFFSAQDESVIPFGHNALSQH